MSRFIETTNNVNWRLKNIDSMTRQNSLSVLWEILRLVSGDRKAALNFVESAVILGAVLLQRFYVFKVHFGYCLLLCFPHRKNLDALYDGSQPGSHRAHEYPNFEKQDLLPRLLCRAPKSQWII